MTAPEVYRIIGDDPGRSSDPRGIVGLNYRPDNRTAYVMYARQLERWSYRRAANFAERLQARAEPHHYAVETNGDGGRRAYQELRAKGIRNLRPINTTGEMTPESRAATATSMDKNHTIYQLKTRMRLNKFLFPNNTIPSRKTDMTVLERQVHDITGYATPTGHVSYKARRGRHDDLFMAMLLGFHIILRIELEAGMDELGRDD